MAKARINPREAAKLICDGFSDADIMSLYNLSSAGLQSLLRKLLEAGFITQTDIDRRSAGTDKTVELNTYRMRHGAFRSKAKSAEPQRKKARISAREAARCIRSGMSDAELMKKYNLSGQGLQSLFDKLISHGLIDRHSTEQRAEDFEATVDLSDFEVQHAGGSRTQGFLAADGTYVHVDPEAVADAIDKGLGDSEILEKFNLAVDGLIAVFNELLDSGMITYSTLDERVHWSERKAEVETFVCPACGMPQFFQFEVCPQCGVIVSKYPVDELTKRRKPRKDEVWVIEMGAIKFQLKSNGRSMRIEGFKEKDLKYMVSTVKNVLLAKQRELDQQGRAAGSYFWVQRMGSLGERMRIRKDKTYRENYMPIGRFTVIAESSGKALRIEGLNEELQKQVLRSVQTKLQERE